MTCAVLLLVAVASGTPDAPRRRLCSRELVVLDSMADEVWDEIVPKAVSWWNIVLGGEVLIYAGRAAMDYDYDGLPPPYMGVRVATTEIRDLWRSEGRVGTRGGAKLRVVKGSECIRGSALWVRNDCSSEMPMSGCDSKQDLYLVLLHEIGHGLGLGYPHDDEPGTVMHMYVDDESTKAWIGDDTVNAMVELYPYGMVE